MSDWVIVWRGPHGMDCETFEDEGAARAALATFHAEYPWNTYALAEVRETVVGDPMTRPRPAIIVTSSKATTRRSGA